MLFCVSVSSPAGEAPVSECDRLAAHPADPGRVAEGVYWKVLDAAKAIEPCQEALRKYPESTRLVFQYGRVLAKAGRVDEALPFLISAAQQEYQIAYVTVGSVYETQLANYGQAFEWYSRGAELGFPAAQNGLGDLFLAGHGVEQDDTQAAIWYRRAAEQGYALAQNNLGWLLQNGIGSDPPDAERAATWYQRAAKGGNPRGAHNLATLYRTGKLGSESDLENAVRWYRRGVELGYGWSMVALGELYESWTGSQDNLHRAYDWFNRAANIPDDEIRDLAMRGRDRVSRAIEFRTRQNGRR